MRSGVYRHYKGGLYQCLGVAAHSETDERFVVYVSLTGADLPGPRLRVRPAELWDDWVGWPEGVMRPRFVWLGDEVAGAPNVSEDPPTSSPFKGSSLEEVFLSKEFHEHYVRPAVQAALREFQSLLDKSTLGVDEAAGQEGRSHERLL